MGSGNDQLWSHRNGWRWRVLDNYVIMPITINGSGTITGISAGGLPDNSVTSSDVNFTPGKIIQVVMAECVTEAVMDSTTFEDTNLSATITPSSGTKIAIWLTQSFGAYGSGDQRFGVHLYRDSTKIRGYDKGYIGANTTGNNNNSTYNNHIFNQCYLDTHGADGSTAVTYKTRFARNSTSGGGDLQADKNCSGSGISATNPGTMILMEVAA